MYCTACGALLEDAARFCMRCGTRVAGPELPPEARPAAPPAAATVSAPDPFTEPLALIAQARECEERGASNEAAAWYERALAEFGARCEHPAAGSASMRLGLLYTSAGKSAEAELLLKRGLALLAPQPGPDERPLVRAAFAQLMEIYVDRNSRAEIEALSRRHPALLAEYVEPGP